MARSLLNLCAVSALLLGGWGGVLAAVACLHVGCETAAAAAAHAGVAAHGGHAGGHEPADHDSHAGKEVEHGGHAAATPPAGDLHRAGTGEARTIDPRQPEPGCSHCVGSPAAPTSSLFGQQFIPPAKGESLIAPPAGVRVEAPAAAFIREITPAQHAPPGGTGRHLLLNVFRI
ncbi:MAG TPA: hypothetical protein VK421_13355 [Pyrinomonadaceae bacterium]|nr:hypothetical protein [Pyrinomonadaceae bacterium]